VLYVLIIGMVYGAYKQATLPVLQSDISRNLYEVLIISIFKLVDYYVFIVGVIYITKKPCMKTNTTGSKHAASTYLHR